MDMHDKIVKAACQIISTNGIEAASTREICRRVGISAPTLYHYFPNKQHLMSAVTYGAYNKYLERPKKNRQLSNPIKSLVDIWNRYFKFVEHEPDFFNIILLAHAQANIPTTGYKLYEATILIFEDARAKGLLKVSPKIATQLFYSTALGSALLYVSQKRNPKIKESFKKSLRLVLKSLFKD